MRRSAALLLISISITHNTFLLPTPASSRPALPQAALRPQQRTHSASAAQLTDWLSAWLKGGSAWTCARPCPPPRRCSL